MNKEYIKDNIAKGEIETVLKELQKFYSDGREAEVIQLSGRYFRVKKDFNKGIIEYSILQLTTNQVVNSILELLKEDSFFNKEIGFRKFNLLFSEIQNDSNHLFSSHKMIYQNVLKAISKTGLNERIDLNYLEFKSLDELYNTINNSRPNFVYLSSNFNTQLVSQQNKIDTDSILDILGKFKDTITTVFINSCHSEDFALKVRKIGIPYTIGHNGTLMLDVADSFTTTFLKNISEGKNIEDSFSQARLHMKIQWNSKESDYVLMK